MVKGSLLGKHIHPYFVITPVLLNLIPVTKSEKIVKRLNMMQYRIFPGVILVKFLLPALLWSQNSTILLDFGREQVGLEEFERVYQKNNGGYEAVKGHSPEQYREYLDLYVNFKRKVFEAEDMGIHETEAFRKEFEGYRKQLVEPYLTASDVEEALIKEAYDRQGMAVKAAHLLLRLAPDAPPEDTLRVFQRISALRDSVVSGARSFAYLAEKYSEDPSAKQNQGDLGYFSAFDMVYPFESAAFSTPVNSVSQPVRTQFGYHLIQVSDKAAISGEKTAAHIIIRVGDRYTAKDTTQAEKMIREIYEKLEAGEDFAALARQYSDDPSSAANGGELGTGRLIPVMENIKVKLQEGDYSEPFTTPYGWHIMKVTQVSARPDFEAARAEIKARISRDSRSQISREALISRIKKNYGYTPFPDNVQAFIDHLDNRFPIGGWQPDSTQFALYQKPLYQLEGEEPVSLQALVDYYLAKRPRYPRSTPEEAARGVLDNFVRDQLLAYEEAQLPVKDPEFGHLLKEYRDGILIFTLMEQKVWKKAVEDTLGLRQFYEDHKDRFFVEAMADVREYQSPSESVISEVKTLLEQGKADAYIDSVVNRNSSLTLRVITQTYEKGRKDDQLLGLPWDEVFFSQPEGAISAVRKEGETFKVLVIEKKYPAGIKSFDKAKSACITQYQDYLEAQWLKELAEKYPVEINENAFANLYK